MLPRIVLFVLQLIAAWYLAPVIKGVLPVLLARPYDIFLYAILYALIIMIIGFAGSLVLKDVPTPSGATLAVSLLLAIGLAALTLVPAITQALGGAVPVLRTNLNVYPLLGALIGYFVKR